MDAIAQSCQTTHRGAIALTADELLHRFLRDPFGIDFGYEEIVHTRLGIAIEPAACRACDEDIPAEIGRYFVTGGCRTNRGPCPAVVILTGTSWSPSRTPSWSAANDTDCGVLSLRPRSAEALSSVQVKSPCTARVNALWRASLQWGTKLKAPDTRTSRLPWRGVFQHAVRHSPAPASSLGIVDELLQPRGVLGHEPRQPRGVDQAE